MKKQKENPSNQEEKEENEEEPEVGKNEDAPNIMEQPKSFGEYFGNSLKGLFSK